jgi:hypothetical protein
VALDSLRQDQRRSLTRNLSAASPRPSPDAYAKADMWGGPLQGGRPISSNTGAATQAQTQAPALRGLRWQDALIALLAVAILVLLIDRFLDVSLRTAQDPPTTPPVAVR